MIFSFTFFPVFRVNRTCQIFVLDFRNEDTTDIRDEFTYGGLANQPVILQGHVGSPVDRYISVTATLSPNSKGFLKFMTDFLMSCMHSSMR